MNLIPFHNPVAPLGPNPVDKAKQLGSQAKGLDPVGALTQSFSQTLSQVKQTGEGKSEAGSKAESERLMEVSRQFEGLLVHQMLKAMRQTVDKAGMLDGFASEQYEGMFDEKLSEEVVKKQSIGLAPTIHDQMSRLISGSAPQHL